MAEDCFVKIGSGSFHYLDWGGKGPLTHMAHATGFCARIYTPLMERLTDRLHILGMDDRGHGRTQAPAVPEKMKNWNIFSEDMERFIEMQKQPVIAIGHSKGAVASLMLAARRPDMIRALVLIDPTILPFSWMWWWYWVKMFGFGRYIPIAAQAAKRRYFWSDRDAIFNAYKEKKPFDSWSPGFLEGYIMDGTTSDGNGGIVLSCHPAWESRCFAVCNHDAWYYVRKNSVPTMVIYGKESDTFLPPARNRYRKVDPEAKMVGFEHTGHFAPMEEPEKTAEAIIDFLAGEGLITA